MGPTGLPLLGGVALYGPAEGKNIAFEFCYGSDFFRPLAPPPPPGGGVQTGVSGRIGDVGDVRVWACISSHVLVMVAVVLLVVKAVQVSGVRYQVKRVHRGCRSEVMVVAKHMLWCL